MTSSSCRRGSAGGRATTELRVDLEYTVRSEVKSETRYKDLDGGAGNKIGSTSYTYDPTRRLTNLQHRDGSFANIGNFTYTYDLADRVATETLNGTTKTYTYNARDELTNDSTTTYSYDLGANRNMTGYTTVAGNRMTNDGVFTYTYDDEGNVIKKSKGASAETWEYEYDHGNRLLTVEKRATDGGTLQIAATYVYDALGQRIQKQVWDGSTTITRFSYDGGDIWADLNGSSSLTTRYLLGDRVIQRFARVSSAGTATWLLADRQGSIYFVTNATGGTISTITYDGYGKTLSESNSASSGDYLYASYRIDRESGLYRPDLSRRYYDPTVGRWYGEDTLRTDGPNLYAYVKNNPSNYTDPTGRSAEETEYINLVYENLWKVRPDIAKWLLSHSGSLTIVRHVSSRATGSDFRAMATWRNEGDGKFTPVITVNGLLDEQDATAALIDAVTKQGVTGLAARANALQPAQLLAAP